MSRSPSRRTRPSAWSKRAAPDSPCAAVRRSAGVDGLEQGVDLADRHAHALLHAAADHLLHQLGIGEVGEHGHPSLRADPLDGHDAAQRLLPGNRLAVASGQTLLELEPAWRVDRLDLPPAVVLEVVGPGHVIAALATGLEF